MKKIYLICFASFVVISCGNDNKVSVKKADGNYISKKWEDIKDFFGNASPEKESKKSIRKSKKESGNYISKKWQKTKEYFVDSDSVINIKREKYFKDLKTKYPEFLYVQKWFDSNPKELLGLKGDYYKMIKATIEDDGSIKYENLIPLSEQGTFKYLFVNDDAYYIYEFSFIKSRIKPEGVRRIKKGYGDQPMHDLVFNNNHFLEEENFQGNVSQDLFTKNGHLFFEFGKEVNDKNNTYTIDLGIERSF